MDILTLLGPLSTVFGLCTMYIGWHFLDDAKFRLECAIREREQATKDRAAAYSVRIAADGLTAQSIAHSFLDAVDEEFGKETEEL